jgi:hypothetical protein
MLAALFLALRLPPNTTSSPGLPIVSDPASFTSTRPLSVLVHSPDLAKLDFLDFAHLLYSDRISFGLVIPSPPAIRAYRGSAPLPLDPPPRTPFAFAQWCDSLLSPYEGTVHSPEFLRVLLDRPDPRLYAVGLASRPPSAPPDAPLSFVSPAVFESVGIPVPPGLWVHLPKERRLLPFRGDWRAESVSLIKSGTDNYKTRPFFAGAFVAAAGDPELEVAILHNVSARHAANFDFVLFTREDGRGILRSGRLAPLEFPYIFAFRTENISTGRWFLRGEDCHSEALVDAWLTRIANGAEPFSVVSAVFEPEPSDVRLRQVSAFTVEAMVYDRSHVTVLLLASHYCGSCREFKPFVAAAADLMAAYPARWFYIDVPSNDIPIGLVPDPETYPKLYVWPAGDGYRQPAEYGGEKSVRAIAEFIASVGGAGPAPWIDDREAHESVARHREAIGGH